MNIPQPWPDDPAAVLDVLWGDVRGPGTAWDIGANVGQATARLLGARFGPVHAFEPCQESREDLAARYAQDPRVHVHYLAVSDTEPGVELAAVPAEIATGQLVSYGVTGPDWSQAHPRRVMSRTADRLAGHYGAPVFVKVDTEGHEAAVLRGAGRLLAGQFGPAPRWLVEFHSYELYLECARILAPAGWKGHAVNVVRHPHYPEHSDLWWAHGWIKAVPNE